MTPRQAHRLYRAGILAGLMAMTACMPVERIPPRTVGVIGGPERVFARPVSDILPQLDGATATGPDGRVGNELVFWGYRLQDEREVSLFVCLPQEKVNCEARIGRVCPGGGQEVERLLEPGQVRYLNCRAVGVVRPGDLYPGCAENDSNDMLLVGLLQCR